MAIVDGADSASGTEECGDCWDFLVESFRCQVGFRVEGSRVRGLEFQIFGF